jgi:hypothetical protein
MDLPDSPADATSLEPAITVVSATPEQRDRLEQAVASFLGMGLALPDLQVHFFVDPAPCRGEIGLFDAGARPWKIAICSDLAFVPLHELAHAWEHANADDATRAAFMELRGVAHWTGASIAWDERGVEQAAFIVQQNLIGKPMRHPSPEWNNRMEAFEVLTGVASPRRAEG